MEHTPVGISSMRGASVLASFITIKDELKVKYLQRNCIIIWIVHRNALYNVNLIFFFTILVIEIYTVMYGVRAMSEFLIRYIDINTNVL